MKIKTIDEECITFDNGNTITYDHRQDCCEWNYADFAQLDDIARDYDFNEDLQFQPLECEGFRFGDSRQMFFVPCYSEQNGYYTAELDIYYNGVLVSHLDECSDERSC